jgi:hypothetical protein
MDACSEHFHERIVTLSFMIEVCMAQACKLTKFELCYFLLGLIKGTGNRNCPNSVQELKQETFASNINHIQTDLISRQVPEMVTDFSLWRCYKR